MSEKERIGIWQLMSRAFQIHPFKYLWARKLTLIPPTTSNRSILSRYGSSLFGDTNNYANPLNSNHRKLFMKAFSYNHRIHFNHFRIFPLFFSNQQYKSPMIKSQFKYMIYILHLQESTGKSGRMQTPKSKNQKEKLSCLRKCIIFFFRKRRVSGCSID